MNLNLSIKARRYSISLLLIFLLFIPIACVAPVEEPDIFVMLVRSRYYREQSELILNDLIKSLDASGGSISVLNKDETIRHVVVATPPSTLPDASLDSQFHSALIESLRDNQLYFSSVSALPPGTIKNILLSRKATYIAIAPIYSKSNYLEGYVGLYFEKRNDQGLEHIEETMSYSAGLLSELYGRLI
jgi:hypothetical protein